jgi:radical SAM superfamily enzyme YgiQ (UPF0313 family)
LIYRYIVPLTPSSSAPIEKIEKELEVNNEQGLKYGLIHAEDVFLYGVKRD